MSIMPGMVALADLGVLARAMELPQVLFLSLEIKASPDAITDEGTALQTWSPLNFFPGFTELELTRVNCQIHLPFCQIHPWRVGRLPPDFVLLLF